MNGLFRPEWSTLKKLMFLQSASGGTYATISGNPVSFTAKAAPLKQLEVAFSPKQDLHGYDSPWPAGGGKNKCPDKKYQYTTKSVYIGQDNGTDFPLLLEDTTYTLSFTLAQQMEISVYIREEHASGGTLVYNGSTKNAVVTVIPSVAGKYRLAIYREAGISVSNISNVQLELGSSATSYAPYENECPISGWSSLTVYHSGADTSDPQTISITIGQTVYGGYVDVLTGVVTVDWVSRRITSMNRNNGHFFYIGSGQWEHRPLAKLTTTGGLLCDRRPTIAQPSSGSTAIDGCYTDSSRAFNIRTLESYATASEMMTAMGGEVNICYKTDPFTIQLTPQEVSSLLGENNMWSDANGNLTVTYSADPATTPIVGTGKVGQAIIGG